MSRWCFSAGAKNFKTQQPITVLADGGGVVELGVWRLKVGLGGMLKAG